MKFRISLMAACLVCATTAEAAEIWTCSYLSGTGELAFHRYELAPPDLVLRNLPLGEEDPHFRILQNDEDGLVATHSFAEQSQTDPSVVSVAAFTVAINKRSGDFSFATAVAGKYSSGMNPGPLHGKCVKN